jgi:hypothetical protein
MAAACLPDFCKLGRANWAEQTGRKETFGAGPLSRLLPVFSMAEKHMLPARLPTATDPDHAAALFTFHIAISYNICVSWRCSDRLMWGLLVISGAIL